jgi:hypothetical protein
VRILELKPRTAAGHFFHGTNPASPILPIIDDREKRKVHEIATRSGILIDPTAGDTTEF